jgi:hypothetical protein
MTIRRILWAGGALICIALGFVIAQQFERSRSETRIGALQAQQNQDLERVRRESESRVDAMARTQGEIVLQAFAAGISPSVLADRRDAVEIAAVGMLHVPGVAGVHVLALDGGVIYSSDAKLTTTGEGNYRGSWALQATELTTRPSERPDVIDVAAPIASAGQPQAVAWLEYDTAAAKNAAVQNTLNQPMNSEAPLDAAQVTSRDPSAEQR